MRFVVIMDPVSTVDVNGDTSFALMEEMQRRGHRVDHCLGTDLYLEGGRVHARLSQARMQRDPAAPIVLGAPEETCLHDHDVDAVLVRTDPPFDYDYQWSMQVLACLGDDTFVMNAPHGLLQANEKLYTCRFPELMPETIVTRHKERIKTFVRKVGGQAVIKPLDGRGGEGVLVLRDGDPNENAIIEATTHAERRLAMVQVFMPEVRAGDKRILLLEGEPLGALLRVPTGSEVRSNLRVGGRAVKTSLDQSDLRIVQKLAPELRRDGLYFAGIDVIGGKLTEVNVTSPTGIQSMTKLDGVNYSAVVIDWLEARARRA